MTSEQHFDEADYVRPKEHAEGAAIMPFYIICDTSASMTPDIAALNDGLRTLFDDVAADPVSDDMTMLSVITFNSTAQVQVPLSRPSEIVPPTLTAEGGTCYGEAIRKYHETFERDRAELRAKRIRVYRPGVFFLSDGMPLDPDFRSVFRSLLAFDPVKKTGNEAYPWMVSFGFRNATMETMQAMAYPSFREPVGRAFLANSGESVSQMLGHIRAVLGKTIISSATSARPGGTGLQHIAPEAAPGMQMQPAVDDFLD